MRIFVTGAAGFGAGGFIRKFLQDGHTVTGLDVVGRNHVDTLTDEELDKVNWLWKSVHDVRTSEIEGHDVVIHLAAQADVPLGINSPQWSALENVQGSLSLCEALRACKDGPSKVIYAGSGNEIGRPLYVPIDENHPLTPHNPYAFSKAAAELVFWTYQRFCGLPVTVMSNGVVVGPGMRREIFVFKWFKNIMRGLPVVLEGGDQTRDITYSSDVQDAWTRVVYAPVEKVRGEKFQVSYGSEHRVDQILDWCFEIAGAKVPVIKRDYRPGEQGQRECFTHNKATKVLGYEPQVGPYEALKRTWEWMQTLPIEKAKETVNA